MSNPTDDIWKKNKPQKIKKNPCITIIVSVTIPPLLEEGNIMIDILIGDKKNNIITKMQESLMARVLFIGCCWYLYGSVGRRSGSHIETILLILIMGLMLANMMYMPFRLLGNSKIGHGVKLLFVMIIDVVTLVYLNSTEKISVNSILGNLINIVIISLAVTGIIVAVNKKLAVHSQNKSFIAKDLGHMDGWEFERWSGEWLQQHGYQNVQVTSGSGDYGADVLCSKNGVTYAVQCKLYSGKIPYRAVEEVVCAREYYHTDKAMIFTNSELTPQAQSAAEKLGVLVIDGRVL
jgi:HJR/Mrr/RecB family endonuclease